MKETLYRRTQGNRYLPVPVLDETVAQGVRLVKIAPTYWTRADRFLTLKQLEALPPSQAALRAQRQEERKSKVREALRTGPRTTAELRDLLNLPWWPLGRLLVSMLDVSWRRPEGNEKPRYRIWFLRE